ncbi:MAG TPA: RDD family protein [Gammaproteobacteria bacterium]|jgi:uncharacterized RDD family membrane protein YckC|nr:RDD family protein [Gammaproteobacteria bacterium]
MPDVNPDDFRPAPLWRRLAAASYDALVVLGLWFIATAVAMPVARGAITPDHPLAELLYRLYILAVGFLFFGSFWVRNGQTLGMLAWRVKLVDARTGGSVRWGQALIRYLAAYLSWAALGLGFWWSLWDPEKKTWHDKLSGTVLRPAPSFAQLSNS